MAANPNEWISLAEALATLQNLDPTWDAKALIGDALSSGSLRSRSSGGSAKCYKPEKETLGPLGEIEPAVWESIFERPLSFNGSELNWRAGSCRLNFRFYGQLSFIKVSARDFQGLVGQTVMAAAVERLEIKQGLPSADDRKLPISEVETSSKKTFESGRRPANWWPDFARELAIEIHDNGLPENQSILITRVQARFSHAGKPEPSRSQIQPVIREIFAAIGPAGNSKP